MQLTRTMQDMAEGTAEPSIFLASLDPGLGKSSSVVAFAQALVSSAEHREAGMIVCVGRIDEAKSLAGDMREAGIGRHVAVRTSDETANALSGAEAPDAQVLIVTQQKVEIETRYQAFKSASLFHYHGTPREVRIWDESWIPGKPITLERVKLGRLLAAAHRLSPAFGGALEDVLQALKSVPTGDLFMVPDWSTLYGVTEAQMLSLLGDGPGGGTPDDRLTASILFIIAGKGIRVCREVRAPGGDERVVISFQDTLPEDLAPMLVLDASIRVRQTYADALEHRNVKMLPKAVKDYGPLTVHLWRTGGGKSGFERNGAELIRGMANTIMDKPDEEWLVVTHVPGRQTGDIEAQLRRALPAGAASRVSVLTWGRHLATNQFRDCPNVILGGTLFMNEGHYLALTHLAQNRRMEDYGFADPEAVVKITHGEHRHLILQAACRGRVRQCEGLSCLPMDLYIIASTRSAIPTRENIDLIFPGAAVKRWTPFPPKLSGKVLDAAGVLASLISAGALSRPDHFLAYKTIADAMPGRDGTVRPMAIGDFKKRVAGSEMWRDHLATIGLTETEQKNGARSPVRGLRLLCPDEVPEWVDAPSPG